MEEILNNPWFLLAVAMGVPGFLFHRIEHKMAQHEKAREEKDERREKLLLQLTRSTNASIALGEATARAVQRIPDAHCNGDMHAALEYAAQVKHEGKDFLAQLGIHALVED